MTFPAEDFIADRPRPSPLYIAAASASVANIWTSVNGATTARVYTDVEGEYAAALSGVGVVDASPLARYRVRGADAGRALNRLTTTPAARLKIGETAPGLLCDNAGRVVDIADVARLAEDDFVLTLQRRREMRLRACCEGLDAVHQPLNDAVAALAVLGPGGPALLKAAGFGADAGAFAETKTVKGVRATVKRMLIAGAPAVEIVFPADEALLVWERLERAALSAAGPRWIGLDALEALRIENAVPRLGLDFDGAEDRGEGRARLPVEIGLGFLAPLDSAWYSGRAALRRAPSTRRRLVAARAVAGRVARGAAAFVGGRPVGAATSTAYSPRLRSAVAMIDLTIDPDASLQDLRLAADRGDDGVVAVELGPADRPEAQPFKREKPAEDRLAAVGR
ncbi:MAG: hypothetical protein AAFV51_08690 [Pseudomonadota bacterium]